jgi:carbon storage regulator
VSGQNANESNVRSVQSTEGLTNRRDQGVTGFLQAVGVRCKSLSLSRRNRTAFITPANSRQGSAFLAVTPRLFAGFLSLQVCSVRRCAILVLTRSLDEKIIFDVPASSVPQRIVLNVNEIRPEKVRLGIEADRSIAVHRLEIAEAIERDGLKPRKERPAVAPVVRIGERLPGELMRRKPQ